MLGVRRTHLSNMEPTSRSQLLAQFEQLAADGDFGLAAEAAVGAYAQLPNDVARAVKYVVELYEGTEEPKGRQARDLVAQLLLVTYREAKGKDEAVASNFANAFIDDYPGTTGTSLLAKWISLAEAALGFKSVGAKPNNRSLLWQQSSRLVQMTNEFLDGLLGLLIVAWRCGLGKTVNRNVLTNAYGSKLDEFESLTGGEDGPFYLLFRIADPPLRNGIAHGTAWLDRDAQEVRYTAGRQVRQRHSLELTRFMEMAYCGSYLAQAYLAALATIVVLEGDNVEAASLLPHHLVRVMNWHNNDA